MRVRGEGAVEYFLFEGVENGILQFLSEVGCIWL